MRNTDEPEELFACCGAANDDIPLKGHLVPTSLVKTFQRREVGACRRKEPLWLNLDNTSSLATEFRKTVRKVFFGFW